MLCALPVFAEDTARLLDLLIWLRQLGGCPQHDAVLVADAATPASSALQLFDTARTVFRAVQLITNPASVLGWPQGPNSLFLTAARHARESGTPWLFLEPDAVPLRTDWLDQLTEEYQATGARYLGQIVPCNEAGLPAQHFTGVGIYPPEAFDDLAPLITAQPNLPFDLATAAFLVPRATHSLSFQHLWGERDNPPRFAPQARPGTAVFSLDYLRPQALLFHRNKDGSLIKLLRQRLHIHDETSTFIQLGRAGDIILLMPAMKFLYETTGVRPRLIVAEENANILEGVSYVESMPLRLHWWFGMAEAIAYANKHFGGVTVIQCHADRWTHPDNDKSTFMQATHRRTGVPSSLFHTLPMVFDRRSPKREQEAIPNTNGKPYIAINTSGFSSPFPYVVELMNSLHPLRSTIAIVDLAKVKLPRIYDLLGIFDHALGTIHIDTATLHLAQASPKPYIGFTRGGWASATPRGNCVLTMDYAQYPRKIADVVKTVTSWIP